MRNRRGSGNAQSIRQLQKPVSSCITPTSALTPITGFQRVQEAAKEHDIPFKVIHITDKESAQNVPAPVTTYALFRDGKFLTQSIQSDKNFWRWLGSGTESSYIGKSSIRVQIRGAYPRSRRSASILLFQSAVSGSQSADAAHGIADDLIVQRRACPVAPIVYRPVGPDTEARRLPCCVDVRAEEQKLPAVPFLLPLDHPTHRRIIIALNWRSPVRPL